MPFEYRVDWSGSALTGPGVSVFHARSDGVATAGATAQSLADRCRKFFDDVKALMAPGITWTFPNEVTELETGISETTGKAGTLLDVHAITAPAVVNSSGASANHSRPSGARIDWNTSAVVEGRRLRGRTYLVPLGGANYDAAGSLAATAIPVLTQAGINFANTGVFTAATPCVWSRTHGVLADIIGASVDDRASILRSRRD